MEITEYKCINVQTLQSHIQESVENKETNEETKGQANQESRTASTSGFAALDPFTSPEAPPDEILPVPIQRPFEDKPIDEFIANIRCECNCIHTVCSQSPHKNPSEPKVIWYDCKEECLTKIEMMDTRVTKTNLLRRSATNLTVRNQSAGMSIRL